MRCKMHPSDLSSDEGVCASCLRAKLFPILAAQSDDHPQPLIFPRSVSPPHATKSDGQNRLFHSTPQSGPMNLIKNPIMGEKIKFSLFGSRFKKANSDCASTSSPQSSWLSGLISGREKKQLRPQSLDELTTRRKGRGRGRGMSPARVSEFGGDDECDIAESSGNLSETPRRAIAAVSRGGRRGLASRDEAGFSFCLRPLVRARPKRGLNSKSMPPEGAITTVKPQLATAASFCANRSRKMADFGRFHRHH